MLPSFSTIKTFAGLYFKVYKKNKSRTKILIKELNEILGASHLSLTKDQEKRIEFYTTQSCITNSWFGKLRGWKATKQEIERRLYLGAATPLFDDYADKRNFSSKKLMKLIEGEANEQSTEVILLKHLYKKVFNNPGKNQLKFLEIMNKAVESQNNSLRQLQKEKLQTEELQTITFDKGGYATLLYRDRKSVV